MSALGAASNLGATTATNSTGASTLNFTGLATGIDTNSIITSLEQFNQQSITNLKNKQSDIATVQSTFSTLQGDLADLQAKAELLSQSVGSAFDSRTTTSSDTTVLSAAADSTAQVGNYTLTVGTLAQAQQIASGGYSDPNTILQQGTLTLQVGSGTAETVTLNSTNNTLQGLANAINSVGGNVSASIINDGSSTPYRLLLSSSLTGAANTINITNNLSGSGASINPAAVTIQNASDASITLGTGSGAISVTSATNQINSIIPGVTLNLSKTGQANLSVANDSSSATQAVQNFVTSYNTAIGFINQNASYNASTKTGGDLLGNGYVNSLTNQLQNALTSSVPGLSTAVNSLSAVGLSFNSDGTLSLNTSTLQSALSGQNGATTNSVKQFFGLTGSSNNTGVSFILGTDQTKPSGTTPYQVNVTAPATQAVVIVSGSVPTTITISPPDNSLQLKLDGLLSSSITIPPGSYTPAQIASILQSAINTNASLNGNQVKVDVGANGGLQITSQQYGSSSSISFGGGGALAALGFTGSESSTGNDVVGNFVVNGKTEAATGAGQILTGASGNTNTSGLSVQSSLSAAGTANLTVTQGIASQLNNVLNQYLDPTNGVLATINNGYQQDINSINTTITNQTNQVNKQTTQLQQEFSALETTVNNLKNVQAQLANFAALPGISSYAVSSSSTNG